MPLHLFANAEPRLCRPRFDAGRGIQLLFHITQYLHQKGFRPFGSWVAFLPLTIPAISPGAMAVPRPDRHYGNGPLLAGGCFDSHDWHDLGQ